MTVRQVDKATFEGHSRSADLRPAPAVPRKHLCEMVSRIFQGSPKKEVFAPKQEAYSKEEFVHQWLADDMEIRLTHTKDSINFIYQTAVLKIWPIKNPDFITYTIRDLRTG